MRRLARTTVPIATLDRVLEVLERELVDVSDEEIVEAARSLRMNLNGKESAAFFGLKCPAKPPLSDFFGFDFDAKPSLQKTKPGEE
jgi:hypothetical protein